MSISGIDAQIMVARTTDLSRDVSIMQKRNETVQDYLTIQMKTMEEQEQQKVAGVQEAEGAKLHTEEDGGSNAGSNTRHGSSGKENEEEEEKPAPGTAVPAENHIIDVKV